MRKRIFYISNILKFTKFCLIIFSFLTLMNCDIVDAIADVFNGDDDPINISQQEQALNTVITLQNDASVIMENLFITGLDTLSVIDSLAKFFLADTSTQNAWPDSEGVSVDYNSGISGGIFVGRYNPTIIEGGTPLDPLIPDLPKYNIVKSKKDNIVPTPLNHNSIYFDGGYTEFKEYNDTKLSAANTCLAKIGIAPFEKYLDYEATLDVLYTLDQYGVIYLSGHGWHKYYGNGVWADKVPYLLTGEVAQVGKTYSDLWKDILDKKIIIATYGHNKENRYWVSPEYISDRNSFHDKNTFIYGGFCYSGKKAWRTAMLDVAGAPVYIRYNSAVRCDYEADWAIEMFDKMCNTELEDPKTVRDCVIEIINGPKGRYENVKSWEPFVTFWMHMKYKGDGNYALWEKDEEPTMYGAHIKVSVGNVTGRRRLSSDNSGAWIDLNNQSLQFYIDSGPGDTYSNPGSFTNNVYTGSINNYNGNSRTVGGTIQITFTDTDRYSLDLHVDKTESGYDAWDGGAWSSISHGFTSNWTEHIVLDYAGIPGGWDKTDDYPAASLYPNTETKKIVYYEVYDNSDSAIGITYTTTGAFDNGDSWDYEYISHSIPDNPNKIEVTVFYK